ncbi:MAG TPA: GAF domain-containing sensor histidine kinase, partial [Terriglobia bacterium]|nr:GAF domain-containing sensor histidine kinase [Terriglobia bacterium]
DDLVAETVQLMHAEGGCSGLRVQGALVCGKVMRRSGGVPVNYSWLPGQGSPGWVLARKTPCVSNDARSDSRVEREVVERFGIRSLVTMPLLDPRRDVVAFFEIHNKAEAAGFTAADQKILFAISQVASVAIQNALAYLRVHRAEEKLRRLSGQLLLSQDEERRRMARELHDSTAQCMAALVMNLARLGEQWEAADSASRDTLADSLALAEECARECRTLSYLLHPPLLDEIGLGAALRQYVDGFVRRSGIQVYLNVPDRFGRLSVEQSTTLFRIVQESLTNIHRHSGSRTADVFLIRLNGNLVLEVADRGRGFPSETLDPADDNLRGLGVGIAGMQERVRQLGGRLEIRSGASGTTVQATLPFDGHSP